MAEAVVHTVPSETTFVEDASTIGQDFRRYFHRNGDAFLAISLTLGAILLNRMILRRELKRLSFNVEIFPDDVWGDYGTSILNDD